MHDLWEFPTEREGIHLIMIEDDLGGIRLSIHDRYKATLIAHATITLESSDRLARGIQHILTQPRIRERTLDARIRAHEERFHAQ